jgi:hypothetical protein
MEKPTMGTILLDVTPGPGEEFERSFLTRNGHDVLVCHGPHDQPCPLLQGAGCETFERAHGVVFELDLDRAEHRAIVERYRALGGPDLPIRVVISPAQAEQYAAFLDQLQVWHQAPSAADLDSFAAEVEARDRG